MENPNIFKEELIIDRTQREALMNQKAYVLWFTGLSGSGKSTLAKGLEEKLYNLGYKTMVLDGDNTRLGINKDLNFSDADRKENIRRIAEVCKLFNDAGIIVLASFISPFKEDRQMAADIIGDKDFIEIYVNASLDTCIERDPKGLYKKALEGLITNFTGLDSPYEIPEIPSIEVNTMKETIAESIENILGYLQTQKLIS